MRWGYLAVALVAVACAWPADGQQGTLTITPAFQEVVVEGVRSEVPFTLGLTNTTDKVYTVALRVLDFGQLSESGGIAFQGQSATSLEQRYGLASWLTLNHETLTLAPGETADTTATVQNQESLLPGGHYAAIIAEVTQEGADDITPVEIQQALSSLVYVKKVGGEVYGMALTALEAPQALWRVPPKHTLRFQNKGNVHVVPRGRVEVRDGRQRLVAEGIINEGSAIVLPESFRQLPVALETRAYAWLPGKYTLRVEYRYDGQEEFLIEQVTFMYLGNSSLIITVILAILVLGYFRKRLQL